MLLVLRDHCGAAAGHRRYGCDGNWRQTDLDRWNGTERAVFLHECRGRIETNSGPNGVVEHAGLAEYGNGRVCPAMNDGYSNCHLNRVDDSCCCC